MPFGISEHEGTADDVLRGKLGELSLDSATEPYYLRNIRGRCCRSRPESAIPPLPIAALPLLLLLNRAANVPPLRLTCLAPELKKSTLSHDSRS